VSGPFKRFGRNRAAAQEGAIGGLGTSPTSMKPQISAKAENLRFTLYGAHKALLAGFFEPIKEVEINAPYGDVSKTS